MRLPILKNTEKEKMIKKYIVKLIKEDRPALEKLVSVGKISARKITRARILLMTDENNGGGWPDTQIAKTLNVSIATIERLRKIFVNQGMNKAIHGNGRRKLSRQSGKLDKEKEAQLIALARSKPPEGHRRWTLRLLAAKMSELHYVDSISHVTISKVLKKRYTALLNQT